MVVMVSKGFIVLAQNTDQVDYVTQAYALALSIKFSQKEVKYISLVTNDEVPEEYKSVFDYIIPIPWNDDALESNWKVENRWKLYYCTPYDETIVLDTDMLVLDDINDWWEYCSHYDIHFCSKIKNYKLENVIDDVHRKTFIANDLPNIYFGLHYFKKNENAFQFYKILEFVCNNWEHLYGSIAPNEYQNWLSMDVSSAIAAKIYGSDVNNSTSPLHFVHMKPRIQGWVNIPEKWTDAVHYSMNKRGEFVVGNIKQTKIFHYVDKNFITPEILLRLKELSNG